MSSIQEKLITRIEGHGHLEVDPSGTSVKLVVDEGERLFEKLVVGHSYEEAHWITPRICGVCPEVHNLATIRAIEAAMRVEVSPDTVILRRLLLHAQNIVSHILHIFFLAAPDYLGIQSAMELIEKDKPTFDLVIELKKAADRMMEVIGGRAIHPVTTAIGGFSSIPSQKELQEVRDTLAAILPKTIAAAKLVLSWNYPELHRDTEFLSLYHPDYYAIYDGELISNKGLLTRTENYQEVFHEEPRDYATAKFSVRNGDSFLSSTLSRVNNHGPQLAPEARTLLETCSIPFPSDNPFHNTPAQALEFVSATEESISLIDGLLGRKIEADVIPFETRAGRGAIGIGAPRGILFNMFEMDEKGIVVAADIVTPTAQNLFNLEHYANVLFDDHADEPVETRMKLLEMLVRAYDPCVTCSVH